MLTVIHRLDYIHTYLIPKIIALKKENPSNCYEYNEFRYNTIYVRTYVRTVSNISGFHRFPHHRLYYYYVLNNTPHTLPTIRTQTKYMYVPLCQLRKLGTFSLPTHTCTPGNGFWRSPSIPRT